MTIETQPSSGVRVAKGSSYLFIQGLVGNIFALLLLVVATRVLSIPDIGAVSALGMISALFVTIATFAIPTGATRYISEYMGKNQQDVAKKIYKKTLQFGFLAAGAFSFACLISSAIISQLVIGNALLQPIIAILALDVFILVLNSFLSGILFGLQKFRTISFIGITVSALKLLVSIYFMVIGLGLLGLISGWIVGDLAGVFLSGFFASSSFREEKSSKEFSFAQLFKYSLPLQGAAMVTYFSGTVDRLVVLSLSNLEVLGIYSIAIAGVNAIGIVSSSMGNTLFPQFAHIQGRYGYETLKEASIKASRYVFLISTPLTIGLAATSYPTIQLFFGERYTSGWLPLAIISVTLALTSAGVIVGNLLLSLGITRTILGASVVGVVTGAVGSALLVSPLGSIGAALGRSSLMFASFAYTTYNLKKNFGLYLDINALEKCLFCSLTMGIVVALAQLLLYSRFMLPFYIAIGGIIYVFMLKFLKVINSQDIQLLEEILPAHFHVLVSAFANFFS